MGLTDLDTIPETGAVFTIGRSRFADNIASHFFIRRDSVVSISCGDEHSAVICQTGRLFVFGSNDWGQLGLGHKNHISKPSCVKALKPEKVTHVACGRAHTLICTGAQKIFACGSDQEGQLGRGTSAIGESTTSPVLVYDSGIAGTRIVEMAAGSHHSLVLTSDGGVLAWGSNLEGQLGLPDVSGLVNKPTKVHIPEPVKQIGAGYYHSTFLTESGLVYVCGETESGKLGIDVNFSTQTLPKQMQLPCPAMRVTCGGHHTVILAENGNLYCTGSNSSGQLGLGTNVTELHTPKLLPRGALQNETISRIACGESHTAVVTESGKLFTCGDGRHGKLGLEENENNVHELTFVPRYKDLIVSNVACGGCHTILVGRRRETNDHTQNEMENLQTKHLPKKTSLPPLKIPLHRRPSEAPDDKVTEMIKDRLNGDKSVTESAADVRSISEKAEENGNNNEKSVPQNDTDSMTSVKKAESPKGTPEKSSKEMSSNDLSNETKVEEPSKEMSNNEQEPERLQTQNGDHEIKSGEGKAETQNSMAEDQKTETMNDKQNANENHNTSNNNNNNNNETVEADVKNMKETDKDSEAAESKDEEDHKQNEKTEDSSERMKEETESSSDKNNNNNDINNSSSSSNNNNDHKERTSPEKQMPALSSTPPPKPPRLKAGSGNSSAERTSSMEKDGEEMNEHRVNKEPEVTNANETTQKEEAGSVKSMTKDGSSKSVRSKMENEDTIEVEKQNDKERIVEEEKMNNEDVNQDDADVVHSPPPRTGKMSKIFKMKKPQLIENGNKTSDAVNNKPKSKTCAIL